MKKLFLIIVILFLENAWADFYVIPVKTCKVNHPGSVLSTNVKTCYSIEEGNNSVVDCTSLWPTAQDGIWWRYTGAKMPENEPRFVDRNNGTILDKLTGLVWLKQTDCSHFFFEDPLDGNQCRGWKDAIKAVAALKDGLCGLNDGSPAGNWRLPNVKELQSLLTYNYANPAIPDTLGTGHWSEGNPFTGINNSGNCQTSVPPDTFWTSTTVAVDPTRAWRTSIGYGYNEAYDKSYQFRIWPVMGVSNSTNCR